ncbi:MAG: hypothetical protein HYX53_16510 [Chloroflexi bacterium]|nr:hypothetical protein [Chloroflexota bacterium]
MNRSFVVMSIFGWTIGIGLLASAWAGFSPVRASSLFGIGAAAARADTASVVADKIGAPDFSDAEAQQRMAVAAEEKIADVLGMPRRMAETDVPAIFIEGRQIRLADLSQVEFRFVPQAERVTTIANTSTGFSKPTDAWVGVWMREGVPAPEWGNALTSVRVVVIMEDGTGKIRSVHVGKLNTTVPEPPISTEAPKAYCTSDPQSWEGNKICVK